MTILDMNAVRAEEERLLASFTRCLIEIAAAAGAPPTAALNAIRVPAIAINARGFVTGVNTWADIVFDNDITIKDRRLFVRDPDARALLKEAISRLRIPAPARLNSPIIVRRTDRIPVIVRIWPFDGPADLPLRLAVSRVHAILTATPILDAPRHCYLLGQNQPS
jgi:hypothetical protein